MRKKPGVNWDTYFPRADKGALALLKRLLAFDPCDRPTAEEALADPYFAGGQGAWARWQAAGTLGSVPVSQAVPLSSTCYNSVWRVHAASSCCRWHYQHLDA